MFLHQSGKQKSVYVNKPKIQIISDFRGKVLSYRFSVQLKTFLSLLVIYCLGQSKHFENKIYKIILFLVYCVFSIQDHLNV